MNLKRFKFIHRFTEFNGKFTKKERWKCEKFASIRSRLKDLTKNNATYSYRFASQVSTIYTYFTLPYFDIILGYV